MLNDLNVAEFQKVLSLSKALAQVADDRLRWAERNPAELAKLMERYDALPHKWQVQYRKNLRRHNPKKALSRLLLLADVTKKCASSGYHFKVGNGLTCKIEQLNRTAYVEAFKQLYARVHGLYGAETLRHELLTGDGPVSYAFTLERGGFKFGFITFGLARNLKERCLIPKLLSLIEDLKRGRFTEIPRCYFINDQVVYRTEEKAKLVAAAIRNRVTPAVAVMVHC